MLRSSSCARQIEAKGREASSELSVLTALGWLTALCLEDGRRWKIVSTWKVFQDRSEGSISPRKCFGDRLNWTWSLGGLPPWKIKMGAAVKSFSRRQWTHQVRSPTSCRRGPQLGPAAGTSPMVSLGKMIYHDLSPYVDFVEFPGQNLLSLHEQPWFYCCWYIMIYIWDPIFGKNQTGTDSWAVLVRLRCQPKLVAAPDWS